MTSPGSSAPWALSRALTLPLRGLIFLYQRLVSPVLPSACRYHPTCSAYAAQALATHGLLRGTLLAARRLGRCHPWGAGGLDPVPPVRTALPAPCPTRPAGTLPESPQSSHPEASLP